MRYFNPRTHQGCDEYKCRTLAPLCHFNPRTHQGCDNEGPAGKWVPYISIHAPIKGATWYVMLRITSIAHFNPRTHQGCDAPGSLPPCPASIFQSTHPSRVRRENT